MIRNLKALGLALISMLAMSAMAASAAQANPELVPEEPNATVIGSQIGVHEFDVGQRVLRCNIAEFHGTLAGASETLTITPHYTQCTTTPVLGNVFHATVTMNNCDYLFHGKTKAEEEAGVFTSNVDLVCPAGNVVQVHLYKNAAHTEEQCTLTISPQNNLETNTMTNTQHEGAAHDLRVAHDVPVNVYNHQPSVPCGATESVARYTGVSTLKAQNEEEEPIDLTAVRT